MSFTLIILIAACLIVLIAFTVASPKRKVTKGQRKPVRYSLRNLMTAREREFIGLLRLALPDAEIYSQVSMGALIEVAGGDKTARNRFDRKILDYVVCSPAGAVLYAIELDDRSHASQASQKRDAVKDEICAAAGLKLVRYSSVRVDAATLRADYERSMASRPRVPAKARATPAAASEASGGAVA